MGVVGLEVLSGMLGAALCGFETTSIAQCAAATAIGSPPLMAFITPIITCNFFNSYTNDVAVAPFPLHAPAAL